MCRLLGVITSRPRAFSLCLTDAPRSLRFLSCEHPDGWGIAVYNGNGWTLHKHAAEAQRDPIFGKVAKAAEGEVLIAHVRKGTVGAITTENTHPFRSGRWVFAHNGTIEDVDTLRVHVAPHRLRGLEGETDSEVLFAYLLGKLDEQGIEDARCEPLVSEVLSMAVGRLAEWLQMASGNFLLSDGATMYAYRHGRPLALLERSAGEAGFAACARDCVVVASEPLTDEPWKSVAEGTLLCLSRERPVRPLTH
jgi:glutamine amidotransferase